MKRYRIVLTLAVFWLTTASGQPPQGPSELIKRLAPYAGTFEGQLIMAASVSWVATSGGKVVNNGDETLHRAP